MDAIKTVGKKEERMGGKGRDMRGVGPETETRNELSARCVDRVLEMTSVTGRGTGSGRKSASGRGRRAGRGTVNGIPTLVTLVVKLVEL